MDSTFEKYYTLKTRDPHRIKKYRDDWNKGTLSDGEQQAKAFLERFNLHLNIDQVQDTPPAWSEQLNGKHGHHYFVTITRASGQRLSFEYWGSVVDRYGPDLRYADTVEEFQKWGAQVPTAYDILTCLSLDQSGTTDPDEVYQQFGPMPPRRCQEIAEHARKVQQFFRDPEEQDALSEIQ